MNKYLSALLVFFKLKEPPEDFTRVQSESGRTWYLGRRIKGSDNTLPWPDSKTFLEKQGFRILGKADVQRYAVEYPDGWAITHVGNGVDFLVLDEKGAPRFWGYEKQEPGVFIAYLSEYEKDKHGQLFDGMKKRAMALMA